MTVYDRHPEIGGLLTFGIPAFKLDKSLLARRREIFSAMGIRFELNCEVGKDVSMAQLQNDYDALFIGVGTYRSMKAGIPHEDAPGVYDALPFLVANTRNVMGLDPAADEPFIDTQGLNVVVLGGGDTAMDCVRTALRHGAAKVTCAYRRDEANRPRIRRFLLAVMRYAVRIWWSPRWRKGAMPRRGSWTGLACRRATCINADGRQSGHHGVV